VQLEATIFTDSTVSRCWLLLAAPEPLAAPLVEPLAVLPEDVFEPEPDADDPLGEPAEELFEDEASRPRISTCWFS